MAQLRHETPNGYTISIINDGYGAESGLFEVAVWPTNGGSFVTRAPFEDQVIGWQDKQEVAALVALIESWPPPEKEIES